MFQSLFNLNKKNHNSQRVPLEDFNTEAFAGILKMHNEVLNYFCDLVGLPNGNYRVSTQQFYTHELLNCYVDLVLENEKSVCFIENKIESSEAFKQLERYSDVLENNYPEHKKHLIYCTKYSDPKTIQSKCNFIQIRWFEIAKMLRKHQEEIPLIKDYLNFLEHHKMAQDNTIRVENLLTSENMKKTVDIMLFYINQSQNDFTSKFGCVPNNLNFDWHQLIKFNRFSNYSENPLTSEKGIYSEILYSIEFSKSQLNTQIFLSNGHEQESIFENYAKHNSEFKYRRNEHGFSIYLREDLGKYINDENADKLIKGWFENAFLKFKDLILSSTNLKWNEGIINK